MKSIHRKYNGVKTTSVNSENRRSRHLVIIMLLGRIVIIHIGNVVEIKTDYNSFKYLYVPQCLS